MKSRLIEPNRRLWAALVVFGVPLFLMQILSTPGSVQLPVAAQSGPPSRNERVLENAIPKNVPISMKFKKEKEESFKDLNNREWPREFELELTNTGDKPIYFLYIALITDVRDYGTRLWVDALVYGRAELGDIVSKPGVDDVPIKPGETHVFRIDHLTWERSVREGRHADATRIQMLFQVLSFGDGTGLWGAQGSPYPPLRKQQ